MTDVFSNKASANARGVEMLKDNLAEMVMSKMSVGTLQELGGNNGDPPEEVWDEVDELLPDYISYGDDELLDVYYEYHVECHHSGRIWVERHIIEG